MSTLPMNQEDHPAHNIPPSKYSGKVLPAMPEKMSSEWIDRKVEASDYSYRKPVTTGDDFIP